MGAHLITAGVVGHEPVRLARRDAVERPGVAAIRCGECNRPLTGWSCWYPDGEHALVPYCARCAGLVDARFDAARSA